MKYCPKDKPNILILIVSVLIFILGLKNAYAVTSKNIDATIKISICGDSAVEYPEDCEGVDLNGEDCASLGYLGGTLTCDIACSFDTTGCTPIPTPSPTPTPPATTASASQSSSGSTITAASTPNPTTPTPVPTQVSVLPSVLTFFDSNGSGIIEASEIFPAIEKWVNEWRADKPVQEKNCDINGDTRCDIFDFSILLYYIERR